MNDETHKAKPGSDPPTHRWLVLILLCTAQFMVLLDTTIVNIALPSIQRGLSFSGADLQWVLNAYLLTFGGLLLLAGRASDLFVRRNVFLAGLVVFGVASLACGLSSTPVILIASRAVQGVGAALTSATALAILTATFTAGRERNRALGVWGGLSGVAGAAGVIFGGMLTSFVGWEWIFFVNVPIALAVAVLSQRFVAAQRSRQRPSLDVLGASTITGGLALLIFAIVRTEQVGWGSAVTLASLAVAVVLLALFVFVEARNRAPLVPLGVFRLRNVSGGNVCQFLANSALVAMFFFVTLYMQRVLGYSAIETGLAYLPLTLAIILASVLTSNLANRFGFKPLLIAGFALIAGGLAWFAQIDAEGGFVRDVLGPSLLAGAGLGTTFVSVVMAATSDLSGEGESGLASGLVNTTRQVGGALGLAVLSTVAFTRVGAMAGTSGSPRAMAAALTEGFRLAFYVGAGFAAAGIFVSLLVISSSKSETGEGARRS